MNYRLLVFAGAVTAGIGIIFGMIVAALLPTPYTGELYRHQRSRFAIVGGVFGFMVGVSQEGIRQLKKKQDQDESRSP
jgi:hypothetical protein